MEKNKQQDMNHKVYDEKEKLNITQFSQSKRFLAGAVLTSGLFFINQRVINCMEKYEHGFQELLSDHYKDNPTIVELYNLFELFPVSTVSLLLSYMFHLAVGILFIGSFLHYARDEFQFNLENYYLGRIFDFLFFISVTWWDVTELMVYLLIIEIFVCFVASYVLIKMPVFTFILLCILIIRLLSNVLVYFFKFNPIVDNYITLFEIKIGTNVIAALSSSMIEYIVLCKLISLIYEMFNPFARDNNNNTLTSPFESFELTLFSDYSFSILEGCFHFG